MNAKEVSIKNITKEFTDDQGNKVKAVHNVSLTIEKGEFATLLGPSGCGKTTTLRMIAGFEDISDGDIYFGDQNVKNIPANKRDCTMVFQSYALFPHMTVYENIVYGLKIKKLRDNDIDKRVEPVIEIMNLNVHRDKMPNQLSGGQQQRVALARALVMEPSVLLFDEPLSNLDAKLRITMRDEIRRIQKQVGITAIYVTHDQSEAMSLSDKIIVMNEGKIEQIGTATEIYQRPQSKFISDFIGSANFLSSKVLEIVKSDQLRVSYNNSELLIDQKNAQDFNVGQQVEVVIRPESIQISHEGDFEAKVVKSIFMGQTQEYELEFNDTLLFAVVSNPSGGKTYNEGEQVGLTFARSSLHVVPSA
ncbi:ABC transporter ATP-binding protein [Halalkalibacter sp. APA_J-10(15)]|uniref:ABC transporter ATP-binding protein n=1 Tax=unclassified Halalkalibacter TaxID=2893063 RepID=UPI001FF192FB|nr:ABC transporter ATP-binding protein [Halalkalibacter sp. APA_J-10(15)]MCK0470118.1 ABC transporter ATP-binding protein [Halalkalibacter sp. APA_J-10(15)]